MPKYPLKYLNYTLPDGQEFSVSVCGYAGKIRYLTIGGDDLWRLRKSSVNVTNAGCQASEHCLALSCSLNRTPPDHLAHMLEMLSDEPLDDETAGLCGTNSTVDYLVKFAEELSKGLPEELRKRQNTE